MDVKELPNCKRLAQLARTYIDSCSVVGFRELCNVSGKAEYAWLE